MIKYFLLPLFVLFPQILGTHQKLIELLLIPSELTESSSGVGPPNAELIAYILENLFNLSIWLLFNAFVAVKLAKIINCIRFEMLFYSVFFILTVLYFFVIYHFSAQNFYYFKMLHLTLLLIFIQYFWLYMNRSGE